MKPKTRKKRPTYAELRAQGYERGLSDGRHEMYQKIQGGWEPDIMWLAGHGVWEVHRAQIERMFSDEFSQGRIMLGGIAFIVDDSK